MIMAIRRIAVEKAFVVMDGAKVTEDERKRIYETNAARVLKLKA